MQIVQGVDAEGHPDAKHRGGSATYLRLLDGESAIDSTVDNFSLVYVRTPGRFSPRHRHTFDQFRFQLKGVANYGATGRLEPGMVGYFPESVHYGPQTQEDGEDLEMLVLQCGGASGNGYVGRTVVRETVQQMKDQGIGTFKDGVFTRNPDLPGKTNMDSFEAIWEHLMGRPLVYSEPRYDVPVLMHPENFDWVAVQGQEGVSEKIVGEFTECRSQASFVSIDPGATFTRKGERDIYFVISGSGTVEGQSLKPQTTVFLPRGENAAFTATEAVEMIHFRLPDLTDLAVGQDGESERQAAE